MGKNVQRRVSNIEHGRELFRKVSKRYPECVDEYGKWLHGPFFRGWREEREKGENVTMVQRVIRWKRRFFNG